MKRVAATLALILVAAPGFAEPTDWTPHTAAALLDATFPSADACQHALDTARRRESRGQHVKGLSYTQLFQQGRCQSFRHEAGLAWRIGMHWTPRAAR